MRKIYVLAAIFAGMVFFIGGCGSDEPKDPNPNNPNNGEWEEPNNPEPNNPEPQPNDGSLKLVERNVVLFGKAPQWSEEKDRWDGDTADIVNAYTKTGDFAYIGQEIIMPMSNGDTAVIPLPDMKGTVLEGRVMPTCDNERRSNVLLAISQKIKKLYNVVFDCQGR